MSVNTILDLPSWYKLENYDCFNAADLKELYSQVTARVNILQLIDIIKQISDEDCLDFPQQFVDFPRATDVSNLTKKLRIGKDEDDYYVRSLSEAWVWIVAGEPKLTSSRSRIYHLGAIYEGKDVETFYTARDSILMPENGGELGDVSVANIEDFRLIAADKHLQITGNELLNITEFDKEQIDFNKLISDTGTILIQLDFKNFEDKRLIESMKTLIKSKRKELKITFDDTLVFVRPSHKQKIISYNVIPYLDLMIWAKLRNVKIPHRVYCAALFPLGGKGELEFRQTIKVFVDNIINNDYVYE